ncbi:tape measure protein [Acinetobacter radioresistens]|uniref:tape measure protein n=1 Tax=Acinetobacter radioresistens TaxID=40216 RepID=UPI0021CD77C8|nr:tape measure protein [Acinetobacter radioresistens]MCU4517887.1 tape measure protein [Acinetobacter radioresistens]
MTQESRLVVTIDSKNAERNARNLAIELESIEKKGDFATKSMDSMSVATRQLAGYMAGLVTVGAAVSKIDAYTGINNQLKLVTNSQVQLTGAMNETFAIAQRSRSSWESVTQVYQKLAMNAEAAGIAQKDIGRLTETISKGIALSGSSSEQAAAAIMQLGQSLGAGKLSGDEFNSVMENGYGVMQLLAKGMDVPIGQLKKLAGEGKLTSEVVTQALLKMSSTADAEFAKTDATIGQSLGMLSNELTKFVGEAGKSSGAANALSGSIQILANNLELIADGAMVAGIGYLGTAIAAKSAIVQKDIAVTLGSIAVSKEKALAEAAEAAAQVRLTQAQVINTQSTLAAIAAEKALEVERLKAQINAVGRTKSLTRMAELKKIEAQATRELAAAETALAAAQARSVAAQTASVGMMGAMTGAGRTLLGVLGGPVGIGLTVASLVATYLLFRDNGEEANKMLERQAKYAEMTAEEFRKLNKLKQESLTDQAQKDLADYNKELDVNANQFNAVVRQMIAYAQQHSASAQTITELREVERGLREETLSLDDAMKILSKNDGLPKNLKDKVLEAAEAYFKTEQNVFKAEKIVKTFGGTAVVTGNNAQTLASRTRELGNEAEGASGKVKTLDDKVKELNKSLADRAWDAVFKQTLMNKYGMSIEQAEDRLKIYRENEKKDVVGLTLLQKNQLKITEAAEANLQRSIDKRREETKELEKQTKLTEKQLKNGQRLIGISGNSGIGTGAHLDVRYGGSRDGEKVSKAHLARLQAGGKSLSSYRVTSDYGQRKAPTKGASSFHKGIDFAMPVGTPITTSVAVKDVKTAYDAKGGGYYSTVTFEDGVVLKLLHQAPSVMSKVKGGSSDGTLKSNQDLERQAEQQAKTQLQLQMAVATERKRIETQLQEDIKEIKKAGFSPEETKRLIAEYQARADNDIAIAEYALRTKLDDYKDFQKSEEKLLKDSFNQRKFYAARDIELTKQQRDEAVLLLENQYQQEAGLLELARQERLFQAQQTYLHEVDAMRERYRLEREEIAKTKDAKLRNDLLNASYKAEDREFDEKRQVAWNNYRTMQGEMNGTGEYVSLDINMENQAKAAAEALKYNLITAEEHEAALLKIKQDYKDRKLALDLEYGQQTLDSMTSMFGSMFGEQSKAYKVMFAADKAYAIAVASIEMQKAISKAMGMGFPQNIPLIAAAAAQGASILSSVAAIRDVGFSSGGYTGPGGKYDIAGTVHKGEVVFSQEDVARWGGPSNVESLRKSSQREFKQTELVQGAKNTASSPNIIINLPEGTEVNTSKAADGTITIDVVRKEAAAVVRQSWVNLNNSNSFESKQIQRNTTAEVKR